MANTIIYLSSPISIKNHNARATMQAKAAWGEANNDSLRIEAARSKRSISKVTRRNSGRSSSFRKPTPEACLLVARLASLLGMKIRFLNRNQEFSSQYSRKASPAMPRIFLVKSLTSLLEVGANVDAVCVACFNVIQECLKFNDGLSMGEISAVKPPMQQEDKSVILGLAVEASYALTPVLDEGTLIFNACESLLRKLMDCKFTESSDDTSEAAEVHKERKAAMAMFKAKAAAPTRFVYGSESFVNSMYNGSTKLQEGKCSAAGEERSDL